MDKKVLIQLCDMRAEIDDLRKRIDNLDKFLEDPPIVSDVVKGTRIDGTVGPIKITGIPDPKYASKQKLRKRHKYLLESAEEKLLELTCQAEEYIQTLDKSELRNLFRLYFIDGRSYTQVARCMNSMYPGRRKNYTEESVRKKIQRFFEKI